MIPSSEFSLQPFFIPLTLDENLFVFKFLQLLMIQLYSFCQLVQREPWSKWVLVISFILSSSFLLQFFLIVLLSWFLTHRFCIIAWDFFFSNKGVIVPQRLTLLLKPSKKGREPSCKCCDHLYFSVFMVVLISGQTPLSEPGGSLGDGRSQTQ